MAEELMDRTIPVVKMRDIPELLLLAQKIRRPLSIQKKLRHLYQP